MNRFPYWSKDRLGSQQPSPSGSPAPRPISFVVHVLPPSKLTPSNIPAASPASPWPTLVTVTMLSGLVGLTAIASSDSLKCRWLMSTLTGVAVPVWAAASTAGPAASAAPVTVATAKIRTRRRYMACPSSPITERLRRAWHYSRGHVQAVRSNGVVHVRRAVVMIETCASVRAFNLLAGPVRGESPPRHPGPVHVRRELVSAHSPNIQVSRSSYPASHQAQTADIGKAPSATHGRGDDGRSRQGAPPARPSLRRRGVSACAQDL